MHNNGIRKQLFASTKLTLIKLKRAQQIQHSQYVRKYVLILLSRVRYKKNLRQGKSIWSPSREGFLGYTLKVKEKSDVYSFGVLLLELITGKRLKDPWFDRTRTVTEIVLSTPEAEEEGNCDGEPGRCYSDLTLLVDPRLSPSSSDYEEIEKVLNIALSCTSPLPINRPNMRRVVELLKDKKLVRSK